MARGRERNQKTQEREREREREKSREIKERGRGLPSARKAVTRGREGEVKGGCEEMVRWSLSVGKRD